MASTYLGGSIYIRAKFPLDTAPNAVDGGPNVKQHFVTIDLKDLVGRTFLMDTEDDGQQFRARVVCSVYIKRKS
jgi:hypothetical protein